MFLNVQCNPTSHIIPTLSRMLFDVTFEFVDEDVFKTLNRMLLVTLSTVASTLLPLIYLSIQPLAFF